MSTPRIAGLTGLRRPRVLAAAGLLILGVLAIAWPQLVGSSALFFWETTVIAVLFATSVNLLFGSGGIPSFGQAAFYGVGAYAVAEVASHSWPVPLALLLGVAVAGALAFVTSLITWRATGLAFAMLTLAIAQAIYTLVVQVNWLGGYNGIPGVSAPALAGINFYSPANLWYLDVVCVAIGMLVFWRITHSPFGHTLNSIREDPVRAAFLGVNIRAYRAVAFTIAGCGAGLAGGLFAYVNQVVTPDSLYWTQSATPIIMLLLGGISYYWGPAVGAVLLSALLNYLTQATTSYLLYIGLLLLAVLIVMPQGVLSLPTVVSDLRSRRRVARGPRSIATITGLVPIGSPPDTAVMPGEAEQAGSPHER
ncbi:MAG TPA: branched-chain amino acid ABC transporter permease [Streptosporangiaceae bacterium]|nr:branched-chain amino acid ABC transporter permease [Streptosporangiaceae bacterium]